MSIKQGSIRQTAVGGPWPEVAFGHCGHCLSSGPGKLFLPQAFSAQEPRQSPEPQGGLLSRRALLWFSCNSAQFPGHPPYSLSPRDMGFVSCWQVSGPWLRAASGEDRRGP